MPKDILKNKRVWATIVAIIATGVSIANPEYAGVVQAIADAIVQISPTPDIQPIPTPTVQ